MNTLLNEAQPREAWLKSLMAELQPEFAARGHSFRDGLKIISAIKRNRRSNSARLHIGGCYTYSANAITITSDNREPIEIAATLAHELCHAVLPKEINHGAPFRTLALSLGLLDPPTTTPPGPDFIAMVAPMLERIGPMPPAITLPIAPENPQTLDELALAIRASLAGEDPIEIEAEVAVDDAWAAYESTPEAVALVAAEAAFDAALKVRNVAAVGARPMCEKRDAEVAKAGAHKRCRLDEIRIVTGRWLLQARPMVDRAGLGWRQWCEVNVRRPDGSVPSRTDVGRMMKIASSADPAAELERQRAKAKEGMRATRGAADAPNSDDVRDNPITYVPRPSAPVDPEADERPACGLLNEHPPYEGTPEYRAAVEALQKVTKRGERQLIRNLLREWWS